MIAAKLLKCEVILFTIRPVVIWTRSCSKFKGKTCKLHSS